MAACSDAMLDAGSETPAPRRRRRLLIGLTLAVLLTGGIVAVLCFMRGTRYTIELTQERLQAELDRRFPIEKGEALVHVTLSEPKVMLREGSDRISFGVTATLNVRLNKEPKPLGGQSTITTGLRYDPDQGAFFLDGPMLDDLSVRGVPIKYVGLASRLAVQLLDAHFRRWPVYTLKPDQFKQALARLVLKNVVVKSGRVIVTLGI